MEQFCASIQKWFNLKKYYEPMKVAAIIWKIIKASDQPKIYTRTLLIENAELIKDFLK